MTELVEKPDKFTINLDLGNKNGIKLIIDFRKIYELIFLLLFLPILCSVGHIHFQCHFTFILGLTVDESSEHKFILESYKI